MTSLTDWTYAEESQSYKYDLIDSSHFLAILFISSIGLCYIVKFAAGTGNKRAQVATTRVLLLVFFSVLLSQLIQASLTLPNRKDEFLHRWDCLYSEKGGKVSYDNSEDPNPCYCAQDDVTGTLVQSISNGSLACSPDTQTFKYLDGTRDCSNAKGPQCSLTSPCTPCEMSKSAEFGDEWMRCRSCTSPLDKRCDFVEGVGPYCYKSSRRSEIGPCAECCTDPDPNFDDHGKCL